MEKLVPGKIEPAPVNAVPRSCIGTAPHVSLGSVRPVCSEDDDAYYFLSITVFIVVSVLYLFLFKYIIVVIDFENRKSREPPPTIMVGNAQASGDTSPTVLIVGTA